MNTIAEITMRISFILNLILFLVLKLSHAKKKLQKMEARVNPQRKYK